VLLDDEIDPSLGRGSAREDFLRLLDDRFRGSAVIMV
jgi:hypothetical protein